MGNSASSKAFIQSEIDSLQSSITNVLSRYSTTVNAGTSSNQFLSCKMMPTFTSNYCNIECSNKNSTDFKTLTSATSQSFSNISNDIQSVIEQRFKQDAAAISEFLGGNADAETITKIKDRITQIVSNTFSAEAVTAVAANSANNQALVAILDGTVNCKTDGTQTLRFSNNIQLDMVANTLTNNLSNAIVSDSMLQQIAQSVEQKSTAKSEGPAKLLWALVGCMLAFGLMKLMIAHADKTAGRTGHPRRSHSLLRLLQLLVILLVVYLVYAYWKKIGPFKRQYWGCNVVNGVNQGCKQYNNEQDGPFPSKSACEQKTLDGRQYLNCPQYWGCARNAGGINVGNKCAQIPEPRDDGSAYFATQQECEIAGSGRAGLCGTTYGCQLDDKGYIQEDGKCVPFNNDVPLQPEVAYAEQAQCEQQPGGCHSPYILRLVGDPKNPGSKSCEKLTVQAYNNLACCLTSSCGVNGNQSCDPSITASLQGNLFSQWSAADGTPLQQCQKNSTK